MERISTNAERVTFLCETYDISENCAKALLLSEIGFSHSGIANKLGVTSGTAKSYLSQLQDKIGKGVTESVPKSVRYPTFPGDTPKSEVRYSGDYVNISDKMDDRDLPLNRGVPLSEIPAELITLDLNIEVDK